jgi:glycine cleavage system H protein
MANRLFAKTHEWVTVEGTIATVGITDFAQSQLGDVVFLELPKAGRKLARSEAFGVIESVKAASDLYAPVAGTVTAVNEKLTANPELVNADPFGEGWLLKIEFKGELPSDLLDEAAYKREAEASAH